LLFDFVPVYIPIKGIVEMSLLKVFLLSFFLLFFLNHPGKKGIILQHSEFMNGH